MSTFFSGRPSWLPPSTAAGASQIDPFHDQRQLGRFDGHRGETAVRRERGTKSATPRRFVHMANPLRSQ
jgi:hypothetical protein